MARTPSNMLPLGTDLPQVTLPDGAGDSYDIHNNLKENGLLVMFICNHCPFVLHIADYLAPMALELSKLGVGSVAISANDVEKYPDDSPEKMVAFAANHNFPFPYLYDESQDVARAFDAACTPDFYLFDGDGKLVYRGQMDNARPGNDEPVDGADLLAAARALAAGDSVAPAQRPSLGCNIKWKE
ncbi:thioredoxin family protein [Gilvimarinus xylanilyticus]|uniref:Thioredoxin family protein n=1 Tax=Gilvimarinus xylanilyticus TaxID=2944139 RepID=A0A9X2HU93_9GAMM|nr:thioredoxin family protein [Gilvimarinus xylanilyticus]MCP8897739.1 thioredoxin family protein [Gilvimarinus xylanilyticus]